MSASFVMSACLIKQPARSKLMPTLCRYSCAHSVKFYGVSITCCKIIASQSVSWMHTHFNSSLAELDNGLVRAEE